MKKLIILLVLMSSGYSTLALADNQALVLPAKHDINVYLLHNHSQQSFWVNHPNTTGTANAGWASQLDPDRYSVILLKQWPKGFTLTCQQLLPGKVNNLDCKKVLSMTKLHVYRMPKSFYDGEFWLVENIPYASIKYRLGQRNVLLTTLPAQEKE